MTDVCLSGLKVGVTMPPQQSLFPSAGWIKTIKRKLLRQPKKEAESLSDYMEERYLPMYIRNIEQIS